MQEHLPFLLREAREVIRAVQHLITSVEFEGLDREALARTIQTQPIKATEQEAKEHCAVHSVPLWRGLASVWFKATKKRHRKGDAAAAPEPAAVAAAPSPRPSLALPKRDARPGLGRWKPGAHVRRCHTCDEPFVGDGQAFSCADCAYGERPSERIAS